MTNLLRINNIGKGDIEWEKMDSLHIFHPIFGQLESVFHCDDCNRIQLIWACGRMEPPVHFSTFRSKDSKHWTFDELAKIGVLVMENIPPNERTFVTFHFMESAVKDVTGEPMHYAANSIPPLCDEERRLLSYFEWEIEQEQIHHSHAKHVAAEAESNGTRH